MRNIMRNMKGFTLVELMIVVAIIGILVSVAIPAFQDIQNKESTTPKYTVIEKITIGFNVYQKICWDGKVFMIDPEGEMEQVMKNTVDGTMVPETCVMNVPVNEVTKKSKDGHISY